MYARLLTHSPLFAHFSHLLGCLSAQPDAPMPPLSPAPPAPRRAATFVVGFAAVFGLTGGGSGGGFDGRAARGGHLPQDSAHSVRMNDGLRSHSPLRFQSSQSPDESTHLPWQIDV